jgi:Fur family ferric uptake transcriptional regulator
MSRAKPTRKTAQGAAIRRVFADSGRPLGPREALKLAQKRVPALGVATVYRAIHKLVGEAWLVPVLLPGEPARYEQAGKHHHHHFRCRRCGGVFEVAGCPGGLRKMLPRGFKLEGHDLVLAGLCAACAPRRGAGGGS